MALLPVGWMAGILAVLAAGVCYLRKKCGRSLIWWFLPLFVACGILTCRKDAEESRGYERIAAEVKGQEIQAEGTVKGIQKRRDGDGLVLELGDVFIGAGETKKGYGGLLVYTDPEEGDGAVPVGGRVRVRGRLERFAGAGNPGEFDSEGYYHAIGIEGKIFARDAVCLKEGYSLYLDGIYRLRCHAGAVLDRICAEEDTGIFHAVILGEKTELSADIKRLYQISGISHLLAVSGLHISMIGLGCYSFLRRLGAGFSWAGAGGTAVTVTYGILAGGAGISASVSRAVLMVLMRMWADCLGRTYDMRTAVSVSGLILLVKSPGLLFQAGFQLSFGAVLTLSMAQPVLEEWLGAKKRWQRTLLAGIAVQAATCPVVAFHYFEYPVFGILLNLAVIPLMSYVLLSGILGVVLGSVAAKAGMMAVGTGHYVLRLYQSLGETVAMIPGSLLVTGRPGWAQIGAYGAMWCGLLAFMAAGTRKETVRGKRVLGRMGGRRVFALLFALMSLTILLFRPPLQGMEAVFLDVGQGDGICIRTMDAVVLVDGGSTDKKTVGTGVLAPFLKSRGISRVDYAIVSHGDLDHISGLMELLEKDWGIRISRVVLPGMGQGDDGVYKKIAQAARRHGAVVYWMERGDQIREGKLGISCLYPGKEAGGEFLAAGDRNEHSLMLLVHYELAGILLTGDMSAKGEEKWLAMGEFPRIQVLKAAHHGSSSSTTEAFLERIKPEWAVISCGEGNRYGHPGEDTLERLYRQGTRRCVTAKAGAVTVWTDGRKMTVDTFRNSGDSS